MKVSELLTGSEHPSDNLYCLVSIGEFLDAFTTALTASKQAVLQQTELDGFSYIIRILTHDMAMIAGELSGRKQDEN